MIQVVLDGINNMLKMAGNQVEALANMIEECGGNLYYHSCKVLSEKITRNSKHISSTIFFQTSSQSRHHLEKQILFLLDHSALIL